MPLPRLVPALALPLVLVSATLSLPAEARPPAAENLRVLAAPPRVVDPETGANGPSAKPHDGDGLGSRNRQVLDEARLQGRKAVTTLVATDRGATAAVVARMTGLGASVSYRNDKLGYVRANVPTGSVDKVAKLRGIESVDLNQSVAIGDPRAAAGAAAAAVPAPGPKTKRSNPYLPTRETGAASFVADHPSWDGRGVTIGILDSGVDLDHPALRTTSTGERKITNWLTATDPLVDGDATWRPMLTSVEGPSFTAFGRSWTAPGGTFLLNRFAEAATRGGEPNGDVNRDGDTTDTWGVLYRASDHAIWVDTDADGDFTDEQLRRPYAEDHQVGHLGTDDPATAVRESMPFVVQYRDDVDLAPAGLPGQTADFVNIGIVDGAHGTHVAGITSGHRLFGGAMSGAAPGAKIVSARACNFGGGCTFVALVEGMIDLVVNQHVDVVNMSIGGLPALNDGNNTRARIYNRLIEDYGVQLFISAGNSGPGQNTVGDPSVADLVVSVAASRSKDTALANYGAVVSAKHALFGFSSRGPREDGGLKPSISAPGSAISTIPTWMPGGPVPEAGYALPPGYAMFNGTSMAAPQATGGAALLLSAGQAKDVAITSAQLRTAIYSSAKFDKSISAAGQGLGELRVPRAWSLLEKGAKLKPGRIDVVAPVCTRISEFLATPGSGTGVYNRCAAGAGGQKAGSSKTYTVTLTRTTGSSGSRPHSLRWLGNDGTFSVKSTVKLPLNRAVKIEIKAKPSLGSHSAVLKVDDSATPGVDGYVPATVTASSELAAPTFSKTFSGRVGRFATTSYFVTVPEGAGVLNLSLSGIAAGSQTRFTAFAPYGVPVDSTSSADCYTNRPNPNGCNPQVRAYLDPEPGVWEVSVESRRTSPFLSNPFSVRAQLQGVEVDPPVTVIDSARVGEPVPVGWQVTNRLAAVSVTGRGGALGSAAESRPSIATGQTSTFPVDVPQGASRLEVAISNPADPRADLDLALYRDGRRVGSSADGDSDESVTLDKPEPGRYTAEVFGYDVPTGSTAYDYRDAFYAAALGALEVQGGALSLGVGAKGTLRGSLTVASAPTAGRSLVGRLDLVDADTDAVLSSAVVLVKAVEQG